MRLTTALFGAALAVLAASQTRAFASPWGASYFPNSEVLDQNGHALKFYEDVLKDHIVVVSFIYTSCGDICPLATARLALARDKLASMGRKDIRFISMTVDPETDTPEKLKKFADGMNADGDWLFITGSPQEVHAINSKLGERSKNPRNHRMEIVIGNAATGEWARNTSLGELDRLVFDILQMDPVWRNTRRSVAHDNDANIVASLSEQPGEGLYRKLCIACHTIGVGKRIGPDLRDVAKRRNEVWLTDFIMHPDKMLLKGDPVAIELDTRFPNATMPSLGLTKTDTQDLIEYLKMSSARLTDGDTQAESAVHVHKDGTLHKH
jgi:protein SCO1